MSSTVYCGETSIEVDIMFRDAGKVASLWAKSSLHSRWSIKSFEKFVFPPIINGQYLVLQTKDGLPLAYVSWALMSLEVEARYIDNPEDFNLGDWNSGDRLWIMDFLSPIAFGTKPILELKDKLRNDIFPDSVARSLSVRKGRGISKVVKWVGKNVSRERQRELFSFYHHTLKMSSRSPNIIW